MQRVWLPRIAAALDPTVFDAARGRDLQRPFAEALEFAEQALRQLARDA